MQQLGLSKSSTEQELNTAETIKGLTSGALWSPETYTTLNNTASSYDQNAAFESEDDDIIDFTEGNPFGTISGT